MLISNEKTKWFSERVLDSLRTRSKDEKLNFRRLPPWMTAAEIRAGWTNDSLTIVYDHRPSKDQYRFKGWVSADAVVLLDIEDFQPISFGFRLADTTHETRPSMLIGCGELRGDMGKSAKMVMSSKNQRFSNAGIAGRHHPQIYANLFFQVQPGGDPHPVEALRYVPYALQIHEIDVKDPRCVDRIVESSMDIMRGINCSIAGERNEAGIAERSMFAVHKSKTVIVLGKDTGSALSELLQVRDHLDTANYSGALIKELPENPMISNEEKVGMWTQAARFSIMIDREPSGHIVEYKILRDNRSVLALLRPLSGGSTYMIGDDDVSNIRSFNFATSPLEVLDEAIKWAESTIAANETRYKKAYPWRNE